MNKKNYKVLLIFVAVVVLTPIPVMASNTEMKISNIEISKQISPRVDYIEWVYKIINGELYMRLYNYKTGEYISEWILVK